MISSRLLKHTRAKVERLFQNYPVAGHKFDHISRVAVFAREIAAQEKENVRLAELAAWLHDLGRLREAGHNPGRLTHHELSYQMASEWFKKDNHFALLTLKEKEEILYAVRYHWDDLANDYFSAAILRDADKLDLWGEEGLKRHFEVSRGNERKLRIEIPLAIERAKRLQTRAAKQIVKKGKLLKSFQDFIIKNQDQRRRVLCALSGGVDSAVAAALLIKAGYEVTGAFIKCYSYDTNDANFYANVANYANVKGMSQSCWIEDRREAMRVAAKLGIKLLTFDFEKEYRRQVVDYLFREYQAGRTPNPDVICNKFIKFPLLLKEAKKRGFDYLATGHYARVRSQKSEVRSQKYKLLMGVDENKDQSYFLHQLKQAWLKDILFPLGNITKSEVRLLAKNMGLPVAERQESMGICFVGEVKMKEFLKKRIKPRPGNIVFVETHGHASVKRIIGRHEGLAFYTIGQRHLGVKEQGTKHKEQNYPLYVVAKNSKTNELVVGHENNQLLYKKETLVKDVNWIAGHPPKFPLKCEVRIRHRQPLQNAECRMKNAELVMEFKKPQRAVTPGQFAVFYKGGECLGGGEIGENF